MVGDKIKSDETKGLTVFEAASKRPGDKRKRVKNTDPSDIEGYLGPWGKYVDEKTVMRPSEVKGQSKNVNFCCIFLFVLCLIFYSSASDRYETIQILQCVLFCSSGRERSPR